MDKLKAWLPIIAFTIPIIGGWFTLQADAKNLKEKTVKIEEKVEQLSKEDKEAKMKQVEIDTKQSVVLDNLDRLIEKLEAKVNEPKRTGR